MPVIGEVVIIKAPPERVWKVVHEDLKHAPEWTDNLVSATLLNGRRPRAGSRLRYELDLGGWRGSLELEQDIFDPPRRCSGRFVDGPLRGSWSYTYTASRGATRLQLDMDYQLTGLLRFAGGVLKGRYEEGIRRSMAALKSYVEEGRPA